MFSVTFDYVISLGESCGGAMFLNKHALRFASYPLDWVSGPGLAERVELIERGFARYLSPEHLQFVGPSADTGCDAYIDSVSGFWFPHDFERGRSPEEVFPAVRAKYERRIARFYRHVREGRRVCLLYWVRDRQEPPEALLEAQQRLSAFFGKELFLLVVQNIPGCGERREERLSEFVLRYVVDMHVVDIFSAPMADEAVQDPIFAQLRVRGKEQHGLRQLAARLLCGLVPGKSRRHALRRRLCGD